MTGLQRPENISLTSSSSSKITKSSSSNPELLSRERLQIGFVLPDDEELPINWLIAKALGAEIQWRSGPADLQWFAKPSNQLWHLESYAMSISALPSDLSDLEGQVDVLITFGAGRDAPQFVVDPELLEISFSSVTSLLTRHLAEELTQLIHPAPSLKGSILIDVSTEPATLMVTELARHAATRKLAIASIGPRIHQSALAATLVKLGETPIGLETDFDADEFGALIQHAGVVVTSDPALHELSNALHGRSVLIADEINSKGFQQALWSAASDTADIEKNSSVDSKIDRLSQVVEQTALMRLDPSVLNLDLSPSDELMRIRKQIEFHDVQAQNWWRQRRRSHQTIDRLRQEILQITQDLESTKGELDKTKKASRLQHKRLNELEMMVAEYDQGPARLQPSVDWNSVRAQIEREFLKILRWVRQKIGRG